MVNRSKLKSLVLLSAALILLSGAVFTAGLIINGFSAHSGLLLLLPFALLCGLAVVLTVVVARTSASAPAPARPIRRIEDPGLQPDSHRQKADEASRILSETAGELRTSVGVIQEELEEIIEEEAAADKEQVQSLYNETDRLKKIIEGMEQLSQAQALARALRKDRIELGPLLQDVVEKTRTAAAGRNITFNVDCEQGLVISADRECLSRILGNLMDNASKAVKDAGTVTLAAARKGDSAVFSVIDTGVGIRRAHLSHIYERFFRGTGSGIGMGLAIVKELVEACGGNIKVETQPGKGTTFTVSVPAM